MIKKISLIIISTMMVFNVLSFADSTGNLEVMPVLISEKVISDSSEKVISDSSEKVSTLYNDLDEILFEVIQSEEGFFIIFNENQSTGYIWNYEINDNTKVEFIEEKYTKNDNLIGESGKKEFSFNILDNGVSTILFTHSRSWEDSILESIEILVYQTGDKLFVEENKIATIDNNQPQDISLYYNDEIINHDVQIEKIDGVVMIPISEVLKKMGYTIKWIEETQSVEIMKGARWTSININQNRYFKNKMANQKLSHAPIIINDRTFVPAEFFTSILDLGIEIENGNFKITDKKMLTHSGFIKDITYSETNDLTITITTKLNSEDIMDQTIIYASNNYTYFNKELKEGNFINVISSQIMTMSIPGQTSGYIIY